MGRMNPTMQMVAVMQEFGWTYDDFMKTPNYIVQLIMEKMTRDRKAQELAAKRPNHGE